MPVGPSELHFVGAMVKYLTLGFIPSILGFAAGLLLQATLFDPIDMQYLSITSLTLILPLIALHTVRGKLLHNCTAMLSWGKILKLDAAYYAGVTTMVGFWLMLVEFQTPLAAWASFALS